MEQQINRVSFSLGTKLLLGVVTLLFSAILFLNISSILLFHEDKRTYVYEEQSKEALLAGNIFLVTVKHSLDTIRTALAAVDTNAAMNVSRLSVLQSAVDNQSEIAGLKIFVLNSKGTSAKLYAQTIQEKIGKQLQLNLEDYQIPNELIRQVAPELIQNGYGFINMSKLGGAPILGVLLADIQLKTQEQGMPFGLALVPLKNLTDGLKNLKLTVATNSGWLLFDSDPAEFFSKSKVSDDPLFQIAISSRLNNGAKEYDYNKLHYLGTYVSPGLGILIMTRTEWERAIQATYLLMDKFILLGGMAIGIAILFAIFFAKTVSAPLERLYEGTKEVAQGNFKFRLEDRGGDEIGALSRSFNKMSEQISGLIDDKLKKAALDHEISIASTVQRTLIPPAEFSNKLFEMQSYYQAASSCGGDWWGFFNVGRRLVLMIADATGHGIPSALMTASARSCFSVLNKIAEDDRAFSFSPAGMLTYANRVIYDASHGQILMTAFIAVIDFENGKMTYSSAGHNPQWFYKAVESKFQYVSLPGGGNRLGEVSDFNGFEEHSLEVKPNDVLILYTDGLVEGQDLEKTMFGKQRAKKAIESALENGPARIVSKLSKEFNTFSGDKPLDDDLTFAAVKILQTRSGSV